MGRVTILVITYNSADEIAGCLKALRKFSKADVMVIDNASSDATRTIVAQSGVRLIANEKNIGFAAAVNQGVRASTTELLLLLNPDARPTTGLGAMIAEFEDQTIGAAGGLLTGDDGKPQQGFSVRRLPSPVALIFEVLGINGLLPRNPVNWNYRCYDLDLATANSSVDVEQPAGAFLMFSRAAWDTIGGFDECFWPIWFEDVDFCARLLRSGFRVRFVPQSVAKHTGGHSIQRLTVENRERYWYGSLLKYAAKHYRLSVFRTICAAVAVGSVLRSFRGINRQGFSVFAVQSAVFRLAVSRFRGSEG